jgi:hypothetical protein
MNTLSRAVTAQVLANEDAYIALRRHWRALIDSERKHTLTAAHHLLYLALLGKDWRRAFTPITAERKLANGAFYNWGLFRALRELHRRGDEIELLAPFAGLVSTPTLDRVRDLVPLINSYTYNPADFQSGSFPFDAYMPADPSANAGARENRSHA